MNERNKSGAIVTIMLFMSIFMAIVFSSGCSACFKALARECIDDGKHAKIENQSFGGHFKDAVFEDMAGVQPVIVKNKK